MSDWTPTIALDPHAEAPLFLQVARVVSEDIRRGRLRPGDELPGSRTLSASLCVHRNTILAAFRELEAEGWIRTSPARGTFVSSELPDRLPRAFARGASAPVERLGFDLPAATPVEPEHVPSSPPAAGALPLLSGWPDLRLVPVAALARAYRRALRREPRQLLGYGEPEGHPKLRRALAHMLGALRSVARTEHDLVVTHGSQQAIDLVGRALLRPGDVVAVEALGYRPAWAALRLAGARLVPVPVDSRGLDVRALDQLCARERVRAVYVTPHHQYPTTVTMSPGRRMALLELARTRRLAVLEDDYDYEFHYEGRPILPLASADAAGVVVYVGTLSKILAPGLRLGFVTGPTPLVERVARLRCFSDRQGDRAIEAAVAELLEDGEVQRHARRMRRLYHRRRDVLAAALRRTFGSMLHFEVPGGGMGLWVRVEDASLDLDAWAARAAAAEVLVQVGRRFTFDGRARPYLRLGFAALDEAELEEAVRRLAKAIPGRRG